MTLPDHLDYEVVSDPHPDYPEATELSAYPLVYCTVPGCPWTYPADWAELGDDEYGADWAALHPTHEPWVPQTVTER